MRRLTRHTPWLVVATLAGVAWAQAPGAAPICRLLSGTTGTYTARAGDSLARIAARFGLPEATFAADNDLSARAAIHPGQALVVDTRHIVPAGPPDGILLNIPQRMIFLLEGGAIAGAYPVAVGRPDWRTPVGTFEVSSMEVDPTWDVPASIQREMADRGQRVITAIPPGPSNPLGDRWLGLKRVGVGIHGTNSPGTIYQFTTHGCIRLHPDDIRALYARISVGTVVTIVYEPVLLAVDEQGGVWVEVHPDVYTRTSGLLRRARELAAASGASGRIDPDALSRAVRERRGRAGRL